jgi:hypothetical protein
MDPLDIREKLAHIDLMLAQHDQARVSIDRTRQELWLAPWALVVSSMTAGAALFAAAFALAKLFA